MDDCDGASRKCFDGYELSFLSGINKENPNDWLNFGSKSRLSVLSWQKKYGSETIL